MIARRCPPMPAACRQRGAASVEFYIVFITVLPLFLMAVLQTGMFFIAKNTVNLAAFAAARAGAASGGDPDQMKRAFAKALSGLYVAKGLRAAQSTGLTDVSSANFETVISTSTLYAYGQATLPTDQINTLNPRRAAFADFGVPDPSGKAQKIIPVTNLLNDTAVGSSSRQTRADALLLKIEVRHCYEMVFPLIDIAVSETILKFPLGIPAMDLLCYAKHPTADGRLVYGVPVVSQAVVRMTVPPVDRHFK